MATYTENIDEKRFSHLYALVKTAAYMAGEPHLGRERFRETIQPYTADQLKRMENRVFCMSTDQRKALLDHYADQFEAVAAQRLKAQVAGMDRMHQSFGLARRA